MSAEIQVDARGLKCPLPVLRLQKAMRGLPPGTLVRLLADDPMAAIDAPHFCAQQGHALLEESRAEDGALVFLARAGG